MNKSNNIKITSNIYKVSTSVFIVPWVGWRITSENLVYFAVAFLPALFFSIIANMLVGLLYAICIFGASLVLIIVIMKDRLDNYSIKEFAKIKLSRTPSIIFMDENMKGDISHELNRKNRSSVKNKIKK